MKKFKYLETETCEYPKTSQRFKNSIGDVLCEKDSKYAFKTRAEAEAAKEDVLKKFAEAKNQFMVKEAE